jgi:hypothetical protein
MAIPSTLPICSAMFRRRVLQCRADVPDGKIEIWQPIKLDHPIVEGHELFNR